jgi:hypothetical protein
MDDMTGSKSKSRQRRAAEKKALADFSRPRLVTAETDNKGATLHLVRGDKVDRTIRTLPNCVHVGVCRADGSYEDKGVSHNLLTNIGRDILSGFYGQYRGAGTTVAACISTAISSSSITATGTPFTASNLTTPQPGLTGMCVVANAATPANPTVFGNVVSNSTSAITIDAWRKVDHTSGTTPTSGHAFMLVPASPRYMALSADAGAASASDNTLTSEITTNGMGRVAATYAHTLGASTFTLAGSWTASGTSTAIVKMGLFSALSSAAGDPMWFEATFTTVSLVSSDTLTVTDTFTPTGT